MPKIPDDRIYRVFTTNTWCTARSSFQDNLGRTYCRAASCAAAASEVSAELRDDASASAIVTQHSSTALRVPSEGLVDTSEKEGRWPACPCRKAKFAATCAVKKDVRDKDVPLRLQGHGGGVGWSVPAGLSEFQPADTVLCFLGGWSRGKISSRL